MEIALGISVSLTLIGAIGTGWFYLERRRVIVERDGYRQSLEVEVKAKAAMANELNDFKIEIARAQERQQAIEASFASAQTQLREVFGALASDALKQSSEQFLQLAQQKLASQQVQSDQQLQKRTLEFQSLVEPIRLALNQYGQSLGEIEKSRIESYASLKTMLGQMVGDQEKLRLETSKLVGALSRSEVRGRWGEMQLRRVAELAGMIAHCDFDEQVHLANQETPGKADRPDMVIRLPSDRSIVIDAKAPLDAFLQAVGCTDESQRQALMTQHADQLQKKVADLSGKAYWSKFERSPEFVVLFIPGESFLYAAMQVRPDLMERAMEKGVVIATPATLMALLKTVAQGWREEKVAEHAREVSELGRQLHERLSVAAGHLNGLGNELGAAVRKYNEFVASFEGRVMVTARKFEELGASSAKALPEVSEVETPPRSVSSEK